ncbi:MAG TPA: tRNA uridine-5-carboxymethylaminomethyl(34) synthesis GTPase MnmE [Steroidobacteraceae bacterium]|nr:tRNA uridine-5-carboxymethylaminomethyl(34) synthesis GTPase MnmE [Steroidobacteraceae bacterium]
MSRDDTIVAAATPPGRGGIAVVRVSGPAVPRIAQALLGALPSPRHATFGRWRDGAGELLDLGIALYFPAPQSFTGEHVLELQGHGGDVVVEALIQRLVQLGARRARAGEFSERAFLNDKLDLAQAEAIADLIDAGSRRAAQAAMRSLQGEFSQRVNATRAALTALRVYVEAAIDFPEEEIDFLAGSELRERLQDVQQRMAGVLAAAEQGALLTRGLTVAIAGRPNAGKSTLMNRLAGHDVAIVTPQPGTTRDLLRERIEIEGIPVELIDTAGLRAAAGDDIEAEGMRRARAAMGHADQLLFVVDACADSAARAFEEERATLPAGVPVSLVLNKMDLRAATEASLPELDGVPLLRISAATGTGIEELRRHIAATGGHAEEGGGAISARARHLVALRRAAGQLDAAHRQLAAKQGELAALELREAQRALGEVVGDVSSDELLGRIFGSFCIGK